MMLKVPETSRLAEEKRPVSPPVSCPPVSQRVDRIVFSIFHRMKPQWKNRTLQLSTQAA
ncbi:MAG: hypothetical protein HY316_02615 [Acidobacteria bacterium]|nr:hypothetical protein [Acidobacteriota bacterium]